MQLPAFVRGLRGKLIAIFVLIKVVPLVLLAWFAWHATSQLGENVSEKAGGMADAIYQGVHEAVIIDGRVPHSILLELFSNRGSGTRFYRRSHRE